LKAGKRRHGERGRVHEHPLPIRMRDGTSAHRQLRANHVCEGEHVTPRGG